uniref:ATP binding cassette subfamily A member 7 n=1 Tax=Chelydra serpentina TaxID=8475 RepID=A0A8C3RUQ8_CHESE
LAIEILWPLFLFFILISVRQSHPPFEQHQCHFPNKALPSAGTLSWIQGMICNVNNPCFQYPTAGETPGVVGNFNQSMLELGDGLSQWPAGCSGRDRTWHAGACGVCRLHGRTEAEDGCRPCWGRLTRRAVRCLSGYWGSRLPLQLTLAATGVPLKDVVCNASVLAEFLVAVEASSAARLQARLCALPAPTLQAMERSFLSQADFSQVLAVRHRGGCWSRGAGAPAGCVSKLSGDGTPPPPVRSMPFWRELQALSGRDAGSSLQGAFEAVTRIACGHPEGGGLKIPSLNWYEDNDIKAFLNPGGGCSSRIPSGWNWPSPYCKELIQSLESNPLSRILWRGIKPLFIGKILYAPSSPSTRRIMAEVNRTFQELAVLREVRGTWQELGPRVYAFLNSSLEMQVLRVCASRGPGNGGARGVGIGGGCGGTGGNGWGAALPRSRSLPSLRFWDPGPAADPFSDLRYVWGGFVYVQDLVERAVTRVLSGTASRTGVYLQQMPYPCYVDDVFLRVLNRSLPLFMTLAWIYSVAMIIKGVVHEKEARLKETMKIMGLSSGILWLSWFISSFIPFLISSSFLVLILKVTFFSRSLLSPVAFGFGCEYFSLYEEQGVGIQWYNLNASPVQDDPYNFATSLALLLLDAGLYGLATWYIEAVFPGQYGIPKPWNFPFLKSYWFGESSSDGCHPFPTNSLSSAEGKGFPLTLPPGFSVLVEEPPAQLRPGVSIRNLVKIYRSSSKVAVNGLSLSFYEGQITSFLGHNGAGKTTTIGASRGVLWAPHAPAPGRPTSWAGTSAPRWTASGKPWGCVPSTTSSLTCRWGLGRAKRVRGGWSPSGGGRMEQGESSLGP